MMGPRKIKVIQVVKTIKEGIWKDMIIRSESKEDVNQMSQIKIQTFDNEAEVNLLDALKNTVIPFISLVAEKNGE